MKDRKKTKDQKGFVALITILVIGTVGAVIATSAVLLGLSSSQSSYSLEKSAQTRSFANACVEDALEKIKDSDFIGSDNIVFTDGDCSYTVTDLAGEIRRIESTGSLDETIRKIKVEIDQINPSINISLWQEVADF